MNSGRKVFAAVIITLIVVIVVSAAWNVAGNNASPSMTLRLPNTNCSFSDGVATSNYSTTVIAKKDYAGAVASIKALIQKYNGEELSWSSYNSSYQGDPSANNYYSMTSTNISATINVTDGDAFIAALQSSINASDTLESPSYNKTTGAQLTQNCLDDINNIRQAELLAKIYLRELPNAESDYVPASNDTNDGTSESNLDNVSQAIQNAYNNANSYNDSLANLLQNINKMSINVEINATDTSNSYYPQTPSAYPDNSDGSNSAQYE